MARIAVTDGDERAALAITRSLGMAGHSIVVLSRSGRSISGVSRFAELERKTRDPLAAPEAFFSEVASYVEQTGVDVLIPVTEASLLAILPRADSLHCILPFPDFETFQQASDKVWVARAARELGIAVPEQVEVPAPDWGGDLPADAARLFVLKPFRSVAGGRKLSVSYAPGGEALRASLTNLPAEAFPLLVQQRILGPGAGVFLLVWDGEVRAVFGHRRVREKPPSGGVSVVRESARVDQGLIEAAARLLERLGWTGVAMVEFKIDQETHVPYLMEINGRFWGSLQLAVDSGVDFPRLLLDAAFGGGNTELPCYPEGVRCRWLLGDLDQLLLRMRRSPSELNLPPGSPGRISALGDFIRDFRPSTHLEVLRGDDMRPFLREISLWLAALWRERRPR